MLINNKKAFSDGAVNFIEISSPDGYVMVKLNFTLNNQLITFFSICRTCSLDYNFDSFKVGLRLAAFVKVGLEWRETLVCGKISLLLLTLSGVF